MAISDRIQSMYENVGEVYDTITNVSLPEHKNIENIPSTIRDSYLEIMNNGIDVVWDNWEKVVGEGTELTLSNTEQAPMKVLLKGNTYQDSTTGKNLLPLPSNTTDRGIKITQNNDGSYNINGTATTGNGYRNFPLESSITIPAGTYTVYFETDKLVSTNSLNFQLYSSTAGAFIYNKTYTTTGISIDNFTIESEQTISSIRGWYNINDSISNATIKVMLVSGSTTTSWEKYTGGNPAPNPDYPMPVHVVSGDNEVEVIGKNLFNLEDLLANASGVIKSGNTYTFKTETPMYNTTIPLNFVYDGNITASYKITNGTGTNFRLRWVYENGDTVDAVGSGTGTSEVSITAISAYGTRGKVVGLRANWTNSGTFTIKDFMLNQGTSALPYEPYQSTTYPINLGVYELCKIGDYQDRFFKTSGKNLLNINDSESGGIDASGNETNGNNLWRANAFIPVKPNTTYTFSRKTFSDSISRVIRLYEYDSNKTFISPRRESGSATLTITTTANTRYLKWTTFEQSLTIDFNTVKAYELEINEGETALPYEPYGTNEWYLEKKIAKVVLNGTESWTKYTTTDSQGKTYGFYFNLPNRPLQQTTLSNTALSNYFIQKLRSAVSTDGSEGIFLGSGAITYLKIAQSLVSGGTIENFKSWLSTHNPNVYYVLETPTYTKIEGTLASQLEEVYKAKSEEGQTNISQTNDDLPFILNVSALKQI